MKILADRHHDGLAFSLRLMAKRLGAEIYFPIGEEWFERGFWDIAKPYQNSPDTIKQYLSLDQRYRPIDGTLPLNQISSTKSTHYEIDDLAHGDTLKSITFDQFLDLDIDIIIASIPDHWRTYTKLRNEHKPKAKVVCQMGNMFNELYQMVSDGIVVNLLASATVPDLPINYLVYHQEQPIRPYSPPPIEPKIASFVHLLPQPDIFESFKNSLPGVDVQAYGAGTPGGSIATLSQVYDEIQKCSFVFHNKPGGDGYGWIIHSAIMLGRPVITRLSDYKGQLAEPLLTLGVSAIDLESNPAPLVFGLFQKKESLLEMSRKTREIWDKNIDYKSEEERLSSFFQNLRGDR